MSRKVLDVAAVIMGAAAVLSLIAVLRMPMKYYEILRGVILAASCVGCVLVFEKRAWQAALLVATALVYTFVRGLPKEAWAVINVATAVLLFVVAATLRDLSRRGVSREQ